MPTLRDGTVDLEVWQAMNDRNEYRLGRLEPTDRVVDIGAHIGAFAFKAHSLGSRNILLLRMPFETSLNPSVRR